MKTLIKITCLIFSASIFISRNIVFADNTDKIVEKEPEISWIDPETYKDYIEIEDKYQIFNFSKYISEWQPDIEDYKLMAGDSPAFVIVLYRMDAYLLINKTDDVSDDQICSFIIDTLGLTESQVSVNTSQWNNTSIKFSDDINLDINLANEVCSELGLKGYISGGMFRESYYNSSSVGLSNSYPLEYADEITGILKNNNIDAEVNIKESEFCWVKFNYSRTAQDMINLYNVVFEEIGVKPLSFYLPTTTGITKIPGQKNIKVFRRGDITEDGIVDISDLSSLSLALIGDNVLNESEQRVADVDGDGDVKLADLATLRQYLSKTIDELI